MTEANWMRLEAPERKARMERLVRHYFDCCNAADRAGLIACFTPDAVHYFPPGLPEIPWRGAEAIADKWIWCVKTLGSRWTIEHMISDAERLETVIEWTHWKTASKTALRGDEWYRFDAATGRIREIRAYYAAPADKAAPVNELVAFDYAGRGYHLVPPHGGQKD